MRWRYLALLGVLLLVSLVAPVAAAENESYSVSWDPEHGYYTRWWFDPENDFINPFGFFYSLFLPITAVLGSYVFFIIWGAVAMAFYLYTQDSTMPFTIGVLSGAILQVTMSTDARIVMVLTMCFLGGGILTKVLLGRS